MCRSYCAAGVRSPPAAVRTCRRLKVQLRLVKRTDTQTRIETVCGACRPLDGQERASKNAQVVSCNDERREVTVHHNVAGKQIGSTFKFDRVSCV